MEFHSMINIALAGAIGTTVMILVMGLIHGLKWAEADMVRAIGSVYTGKIENSFGVGLTIHYTMGIIFSFMYAVLIGLAPLPLDSRWTILLVCMLIGIFHGLVVSMVLAVVVAEHHPLQRFRNAGLGVVLAHLVGHIFYGATVGFIFVVSGLKFSFFG